MFRSLDSYCPICLNKSTFLCSNQEGMVICQKCKTEIKFSDTIAIQTGESLEDNVSLNSIIQTLEKLENTFSSSLSNVKSMISVYKKLSEKNLDKT